MTQTKQPPANPGRFNFYLNQNEACALIGVSLSTFRTLKADPEFPRYFVLLKRPMWRASDIKAWRKRRIGRASKVA